MSYQALYRVWRPQSFDELVGQDMISQTLKNAVVSGQTSHAYLFTGPRGTGKTSTAKILSKAVNCLNSEDGNPCNECDICQLINNDQLSDVIEIDAASNNGVEEIRNLRDNVRYAATQAKYKVYIIDEVHMLTTGAFNALLKTLEEPPERVIFIMATTEPHKIPATILSRVQRFDFQRITDEGLTERMIEILKTDDIPYDDEALLIIARAANGGMRDSISLLDQALSYNRSELTVDSALEVSGSLDQLVFVSYILALYQKESQKALDLFQETLNRGKQASRFVEELIMFCRDMLLTKQTGHNYTLLSEAEINELLEQVEADYYYTLIDELTKAQDKMRLSTNQDLYVEVMTVQLAAGVGSNSSQSQVNQNSDSQPQQVKTQSFTNQPEYLQILGRLQALESENQKLHEEIRKLQRFGHLNDNNQNTKETKVHQEPVELTPRKRPSLQTNLYSVDLHEIYPILNTATSQNRKQLVQSWDGILKSLPPINRAKFVGTKPLAAGPGKALIACENELACGQIQVDSLLRQQLQEASFPFLNEKIEYVFISQDDWAEVRQLYAKRYKENQNQPVLPTEEDLALFERPSVEVKEIEEIVEEVEPVSKVASEPLEVEAEKNEEKAPANQPTTVNEDRASQESVEEAAETGPFSEGDQLPKSVAKLIDVMGEDLVNIHYDK